MSTEIKKLYYSLDDGGGEGGIMELSGCLEWINGDMEANYDGVTNPDELPEYTLTPIWLTDAEYDALPEQ